MTSQADNPFQNRASNGRFVTTAFVLLVSVIAASFLGEFQARRASDLVAHTLSVQLEATKVLAFIEDAESGQRGFLLTGDETDLGPYNAALSQIPITLKTLTGLTEDNLSQQARVEKLGQLINGRVETLKRNMEVRRNEGLETVIARVRTGAGKTVMTLIRDAAAEINGHESQLLAQRRATQDQITLIVRMVEAIGLMALILAAAFGIRLTRSAHAARLAVFDAQRVAVEAANAASRSKSEFLASMSHEIRTPLNGMIGNIELLGRSGLRPDQEDLIFDAEKAAKSLLALIGNVLDFSKIEAGKLSVESVEMEPAALLQEAVDILQSRARQNGLCVTMSVAADVPQSVTGDPTRLRQILLNLLGNAVKFTLQGGIHASLEAGNWKGETCILRFAIHDSGKGFEQAVADGLFQPFMQDTKRALENTEGTGLGLSISKSLVEAFGGSIGCDSTPGEGASFWFTLPVKILQLAPGAAKPALSGRAVMLIKSGDPQPADELFSYFKSRGARVVEADGIDAALALARKENGSSSVLDLALYVDGSGAGPDRWPPISAASELRGHHTLFVIYTPLASPDLWRRALGSGAAALIDKNTTEACLDRNLEQILGVTAQAGDRAAVKDDGKVTDTSLFADKKVLVLEDRLVNQTVIQRQLKTLNIACTIAADGIAGLEALANGTYDVILCDCSMPRMNGYDFTRALRQREQEHKDGRHIPVIAMTANAFREDMEKCFAAGMDDFVSKPVTLDRLSSVLAHWLGKSSR